MGSPFCQDPPNADLAREFFQTLPRGKPAEEGCRIIGCQTTALKPSPEEIFRRLEATFRPHPARGLTFIALNLGGSVIYNALGDLIHASSPPPHSSA